MGLNNEEMKEGREGGSEGIGGRYHGNDDNDVEEGEDEKQKFDSIERECKRAKERE